MLLLGSGAIADAVSPEVCYRDDSGRIVKRRRPGNVQVPCPPENTSAGPTNAGPGTETDRGQLPSAFTGGQQTPDRGPRPAASPVPQPGVADYVDSVPVPDRWRIVDTLGYPQNLFDPYHRNVLKADKPIHGDWFFNVTLLSDTVYEARDLPSSVGSSSTRNAGENDVFGRTRQNFVSQTVAA